MRIRLHLIGIQLQFLFPDGKYCQSALLATKGRSAQCSILWVCFESQARCAHIRSRSGHFTLSWTCVCVHVLEISTWYNFPVLASQFRESLLSPTEYILVDAILRSLCISNIYKDKCDSWWLDARLLFVPPSSFAVIQVFWLGSTVSRFVHKRHVRLWMIHVKPGAIKSNPQLDDLSEESATIDNQQAAEPNDVSPVPPPAKRPR